MNAIEAVEADQGRKRGEGSGQGIHVAMIPEAPGWLSLASGDPGLE
jgi:hypothetical protein